MPNLQFKMVGPPHPDAGQASRSALCFFDPKDESADGDGDNRPRET